MCVYFAINSAVEESVDEMCTVRRIVLFKHVQLVTTKYVFPRTARILLNAYSLEVDHSLKI